MGGCHGGPIQGRENVSRCHGKPDRVGGVPGGDRTGSSPKAANGPANILKGFARMTWTAGSFPESFRARHDPGPRAPCKLFLFSLRGGYPSFWVQTVAR